MLKSFPTAEEAITVIRQVKDLKLTRYTRLGLLSILSSAYNPLGLGTPFMLKGRQIIQQLCQEKLQWDE